jgi:hypothetical protein
MTLVVACTSTSTTLSAPTVLANTTPHSFYLATSASYSLTSTFGSSNPNCPVSTIDVVSIAGGTTADFTGSDGTSLVSLTSTVTDSTISLSLPAITVPEKLYKFKLRATTDSGTIDTADIFVTYLVCANSVISTPTINNPQSYEALTPGTADEIKFIFPEFVTTSTLCPISSRTASLSSSQVETVP